jgi:hypothetical protein
MHVRRGWMTGARAKMLKHLWPRYHGNSNTHARARGTPVALCSGGGSLAPRASCCSRLAASARSSVGAPAPTHRRSTDSLLHLAADRRASGPAGQRGKAPPRRSGGAEERAGAGAGAERGQAPGASRTRVTGREPAAAGRRGGPWRVVRGGGVACTQLVGPFLKGDHLASVHRAALI